MRRVIIITADWDYLRGDLDELCKRLLSAGVECEVRDYNEQGAASLLMRYGISGGVVRIPQVYVINDGEIRRVSIRVTRDVRLDIDSVVGEILNLG